MNKSSYEVEVLVNGKPMKEYLHEGKIYVEGRKGTMFSLRLCNNTPSRKLFIPSIDGLSVMNGKEASSQSGGYIVPAFGAVVVDGWRTSNSEVAEFYFSSPDDSYRKRMDKGNNLGVIGVMAFAEAPKVVFSGFLGTASFRSSPLEDSSSTCSVNLMAKSSLRSMSSDLGTGSGVNKRSEVVSVEFERQATPEAIIEIYYNTREQLEKMGVNFRREALYVSPQAFPGEFCKPPHMTGCKGCDKRGASHCVC
jgi:hypothetical protein